MTCDAIAAGCTWITDRVHRDCGSDRLLRLVELVPEAGERRRRGRPRKPAAKGQRMQAYYVGICEACGMPRLLAYRPRAQMALQLEAPAAPAAVAGQ